MDTVIEVKNLSKTYRLYEKNSDRVREALHLTRRPRHKDHHALSDVSFCVSKGETVGLIGTNGSGKSTILKIITGVLTPTSGEVNVNGRISALLELGAGFNNEYTGIENIYLNGTMTGFTMKLPTQQAVESMPGNNAVLQACSPNNYRQTLCCISHHRPYSSWGSLSYNPFPR